MDDPLTSDPPAILLIAGAIVLVASGWVLARVGRRWKRREPLVPYEPHGPVPWRAVDLLVVLVLYVSCLVGVGVLDEVLFDPDLPVAEVTLSEGKPGADTSDSGADPDREDLGASHPLVILLHERQDAATLALCVLMAVIIAPVTEEITFRLLLQGWLEAVERRVRRAVPALRWVVRGTMPVVVTSLLFASMHYRWEEPPTDPDVLVRLFARGGIAAILALVLGIAWIRMRTGATAADFGFVARRVPGDVLLGMATFLALAIPVYLLQYVLKLLLPEHPIVDPISLFFFAAALGTLYYRTHRIVPAIAAHMGLNAFGVVMLWLWLAG